MIPADVFDAIELFTDTDLLEQFFERSLRDEANDKTPSVFNNFFVAAASPAFGANHDVLGDWLWDVNHPHQ